MKRVLWLAFQTALLAADAVYYPPPERAGGWRSLVTVNSVPTAAQKEAILQHTGLDWDRLHQA